MLEAGLIRDLILYRLAPAVLPIAERRPPDFVVGADNPDGAYLRRWWVIPRNRWFNVYLHQFLRSDDDRALHDHRYVNLSILLVGAYWEHGVRQGGVHVRTRRGPGDLKLRLPWAAHRIEVAEPCWTLFVTGPVVRNWGFHCPDKGWIDWQTFTADGKPGEIGPGCE